MAKSKHSRALFEVIKQAQQRQQKQKAQPAKPATAGSWWPFGKRAGGRAAAASIEPVMRSAPAVPEQPAEELSRGSDTDQHTAEPAPGIVDHADTSDSAPPPATEDAATLSQQRIAAAIVSPQVEPQSEAVEASADATDEEPLPEATPQRFGGPRRELQLSLSYPTIAIAGAAALVLLITAFLAGKHFARPAGSSGPSLVQIRNGKTFPEVLNVNPGQTKATLASAESKEAEEPAPAAPARRNVAPPEPAAPAGDVQRVIGRNYIIVQSYPDNELAGKAADLLAKNDIPVSVEQLDFAPGWYCVVTRVGFDRPSAPEYQRYEKLIRDVNAQAAAARIKKFDPYPYKWK